MNPLVVVLFGVAFGILSGLRAFTPIALISWMAIWGWTPLGGSPFWFLGTTTCAVILSVLALFELVGDKLPRTPARIRPGPLAARMITGAFSAAALSFAGGQHWVLGVVCGVLGGIGGAFGGYHVRRFLVQNLRIPDLVVALTEDFVTIAGALLLVRCYFSLPV